jgi:hypothetical protein
MFTFIMLLAASAAETAPLSDELVDLEGQIDDLEKDGSWVEDPLDGEEKAHLVNREEAVRAYVSEDGAFTLANRLDDTVRVEFRVGKGYCGSTRRTGSSTSSPSTHPLETLGSRRFT